VQIIDKGAFPALFQFSESTNNYKAMKKIQILTFLLIALLTSCKESKEESFLTVTNRIIQLNEASVLKGKRVDLEIMGLCDGFCADSLFLFKSLETRNGIKLYNCNTLEFCGELFKIGKGPGEYINLVTNGQYENTSEGIKLWVSDNHLRRIRKINLTRSLQEKKVIMELEYSYRGDFFSPYYINDTCIVTEFYIGNNMSFCAFNPVNQKRTDFFNFFNQDLKGDDLFYVSGNSGIKPDKSKIAYAMIYLNQVLITSMDGKDRFSVSIGPPVSKDKVDRTSRRNKVEYFTSVAVTNNQIWLLYQGSTRSDIELSNTKEPSQIMVLDWEGNLLHYFRLQKRLIKIFIDQTKSFLYGIDNEENIIRYNIKDIR